MPQRGVFESLPASDGSAYREYVLIEKERGLFLVVVALPQWGEAHLYNDGEDHSALVERASEEARHLPLKEPAIGRPAPAWITFEPAPSRDRRRSLQALHR